jgi:SAM-dependent methyltransferase
VDDFDTSVQVSATGGRYRARNPTEARATYWWVEDAGGRKRLWNAGRSRGLQKADKRLGGALSATFAELIGDGGREQLTVLEIGTGYAHVLLDMRMSAPDRLELHGINVEPGYNQELIEEFARDQGLDLPGVPAPTIHVHNADNGLPFADETFDLIFSVATLHSIRDKLRVLEEVSRTLKPGGIALIEFPTASTDMVGVPVPAHYRQRMEIWDRGVAVDVFEWLGAQQGVSVGQAEDDRYLRISPDLSRFPAELVASFSLPEVWEKWWGCQSVYRVVG